MISQLSQLLSRYTKWVLLGITGVTLLLLYFIPQIRVVSSVEELFPSLANPARQFLERHETIFGEEAMLILVLSHDDVFQKGTLEKIKKLTNALEALPFVDQVDSLSNVQRIVSTADEMRAEDFLTTIPSDKEAIEKLRDEYYANPLYRNVFATKDGRTAIFNIVFKPAEMLGYISPLVKRIHEMGDAFSGPERIYVSGLREMNSRFNDLMEKDRRRFVPIIVLVMMIMLYLNFRSVRGFLLPLASVLVGVIWTVGLMSFFDIPISILTSTIPSVMIAIGTAYGIYFVSTYYTLQQEGEDEAVLLKRTLSRTTLAILFCGVTTAIGFLVLSVNEIHLIRQMGQAASIGIASLMVVTSFFLPTLFLVSGLLLRGKTKKTRAVRIERHPLIERIPDFLTKKSGTILVIWLVVIALAGYLASQVRIDNDPTTFFKRDSVTWKKFQHLTHDLKLYGRFAVVLDAEEEGFFKNPEILRSIEILEKKIEFYDAVGHAMSLADFIKSINKSFNENKEEYERIPETQSEVGQYLLLYSVSGDPAILHRYVTEDYRMSQIRISAGISSSYLAWDLIEDMQRECEEVFGDTLSCHVTGTQVMFAMSANAMAFGVFKGLGIAFLAILILMVVLFRSLKIGFLAMFPNFVPSLLLLATMSVLDIPMNYGTSIILTIALGIAIDDTLHFFVHYYQELKQTNHFLIRAQTGIPITDDQKWSLVETWRHVYKPVTTTSMTLAAGFLVLLVSDLVPLVLFGELMAVTLLFAVLADLTLTPCIILRTKF